MVTTQSNLLLIGIEAEYLSEREAHSLLHPRVAGVVLFKRNFSSAKQLFELCRRIKGVCPELIVCADQEGGRVQRFVDEDITRLPALGSMGVLWDEDPTAAIAAARNLAWLMASELRSVGIDFSFAPVADLDNGSKVIGDRAFHAEAEAVCELVLAYFQGLRDAGVPGVAKHFPGHGSVVPDTHFDAAQDFRPLEAIEQQDLVPFVALIEAGIEGVMAGHVVYPGVSPRPAGFSRSWVTRFLRRKLGFQGIIFSDDLGMAGADGQSDASDHGVAGVSAVIGRVNAAAASGCHVGLVCDPGQALEVLDQSYTEGSLMRECEHTRKRLLKFLSADTLPIGALKALPRWKTARAMADRLLAAELPGIRA